MNRISFLVLTLVLLFSFSVKSAVVETTGLGFIQDGNMSKARQAAIEDAKRLALEQLMGSFISARTETKNFMLASEKIYATTRGRLDSFEILNEKKLDDKTYQVNIKATVNNTALANEAIQLLNNNLWSKKPRIKLNIDNSGSAQYSQQALFTVMADLSQALSSYGFVVLENDSVLDASFELKLNVSANVSSNDFQGTKIDTAQLSLAGMLLNSATQDQISSVSFAERKAGDVAKSFDNMASEISKRVAQKVNLDTRVVWLSKIENPVLLELVGTSGQQLNLIESQLQQAVIGLSGLTTESKTSSSYTFSATYTGWPEHLYDHLTQLSARDDINFNVDSFAQSKLTLSIK